MSNYVMEKFAEEIKTAEVAGVTSALLEAGVVKLAEDDLESEYAALVELTTEKLAGYDEWDYEDVVEKIAEVLDEVDAMNNGEVKEANEYSDAEIAEYMGRLYLAKEAGEISEEDFDKLAASPQSIIEGVVDAAKRGYTGDIGKGVNAAGQYLKNKGSQGARWVGEGFTGANIRGAKKTQKAVADQQAARAARIQKRPQADPSAPNARPSLARKTKQMDDAISHGQDLAKRQMAKGKRQVATAAGLGATGATGAAYGVNQLLKRRQGESE